MTPKIRADKWEWFKAEGYKEFGFYKTSFWFMYDLYYLDNESGMAIGVSEIDRTIQISYFSVGSSTSYSSNFKVLADLIQADLIEWEE